MSECILLDCDGELAAQAATEVMTRHGLQVVRSFDLRTAHGAHSAHDGCACPYHGTAECTCQYVVLLVYGESGAPATLTLHGREAQTQVRIVRDAGNRPDERLVDQILATLLEAILELHANASHLAGAPADGR
jgi:hypothetical protein